MMDLIRGMQNMQLMIVETQEKMMQKLSTTREPAKKTGLCYTVTARSLAIFQLNVKSRVTFAEGVTGIISAPPSGLAASQDIAI